MSDTPTFQIPRDVIEPILQAHVSAALAQAFGAGDALVKKAIDSVVMMPVKSDGTPKQYSSDTTVPWLEYAVGSVVKAQVRAILEDELKNHQDQLRELLVKQLRANGSPLLKQLAAAMVAGIANENTLKWGMEIKINCHAGSRY